MIITRHKIQQFRREAAQAGDLVAVMVCELALGEDGAGTLLALDEADLAKLEELDLGASGDTHLAAIEQVERWILDARAQGGRS